MVRVYTRVCIYY